MFAVDNNYNCFFSVIRTKNISFLIFQCYGINMTMFNKRRVYNFLYVTNHIKYVAS